MAIVIEEKDKKAGMGIFTFLIWLVFLGVVGAGAYYVFFTQPELLEVTAPDGFESTEQISKIKLPVDVVESAQFNALRSYVTIPPLPTAGKNNPFLGF